MLNGAQHNRILVAAFSRRRANARATRYLRPDSTLNRAIKHRGAVTNVRGNDNVLPDDIAPTRSPANIVTSPTNLITFRVAIWSTPTASFILGSMRTLYAGHLPVVTGLFHSRYPNV